MPKKIAYKKRAFKKKAVPKGRARVRRTGPVAIPGTLAPQHMLVKLKYVNNFQKLLAAGGAIQSLNQYRLNSIYDPDYTNTLGTSVLGWAQWKALYQRYRVFKMDYVIRLTNLTPDTAIAGALVPANYVDTTYSRGDFMRPLARRFELGNNNGMNRSLLKGSIYLPKLTGITGAQYKATRDTECGFDANPLMPLLMNILVQSTNVSGQIAVACQVDFTYHVELMGIGAGAEALDHATGLPEVPVSAPSSPS
ncbi:Cap [Chicken proventriculitis-associated circular virus 14]|nr:Cap [Chicken proventriculitis-associated circular virus 14]